MAEDQPPESRKKDAVAELGESPSGSSSGPRATLAALLVLIIVTAGSVAIRNGRRYFAPPPAARKPEPVHVPLPEDFGDPDAPLKIEVCVGPCITYVAESIASTFKAWPDKVRAEFHDYESEDGAKFVQKHGEEVACIFINGKNRFTIDLDGKKEEVHLAGPPPESYTMRELTAVLKQQCRKVLAGKEGGKLPEGLEKRLAELGRAAGGCQAPGMPGPALPTCPQEKSPGKTRESR